MLFHSIGRVELLTDIIYNKLKDTEIIFPRSRDYVNKVTVFELPSNGEIQTILDKSRKNAVNDAKAVGMELQNDTTIACKIKVRKNATKVDDLIEELNLNDEPEQDIEDIFSSLSLDLDPDAHHSANNLNPFLDLIDKNGNTKTVRKSSVISLLSTTKNTVSNDRLRRVQNFSNQTFCRRLEFTGEEPKAVIYEANTIYIGDWSVCKTEEILKTNYSNIFSECLIVGVVLGFRHNEKARWQRALKYDTLKLTAENLDKIEILAHLAFISERWKSSND